MRIINQSISFLIVNAILSGRMHSQVKDNSPGTPGGNGLNVQCASQLIIDDFKSSKKWKVVVSGSDPITHATVTEEISYKALGMPPFINMSWKLGSGSSDNYWDLKPLLPITWAQKGKAFIPEAKLPKSNSDFGEANGVVKLERAPDIVFSTDPNPNPAKSMKVFFRRYDNNIHDMSVPNWFYYWKQLVTSDLALPSIPILDETTRTWISNPPPIQFTLEYHNSDKYKWKDGKDNNSVTYGSNAFSFRPSKIEHPSGSGNYVGTGFPYSPIIKIGEGCGYWQVIDPNIDGIECFISTLNHELHHTNLFFLWYPEGYDSTKDTDGDYYPNSVEKEYNDKYKNHIYRKDHLFNEAGKDTYTRDYKYEDYKNEILNAPTMLEEDLCRAIENTNKSKYNDKDWSYDPNKKAKGKNW